MTVPIDPANTTEAIDRCLPLDVRDATSAVAASTLMSRSYMLDGCGLFQIAARLALHDPRQPLSRVAAGRSRPQFAGCGGGRVVDGANQERREFNGRFG